MLNNLPFYNRTIRKIVTGFGSLFTNLTLVRYNNDGSENERFIVPFAFGMKEKYIQALQGDPQNDKKVQITLPQMAFNILDMRYDATRKQQSTIQNFAITSQKSLQIQYVPVPYNFDFEVYVYVRTFEDGFQILEQILPFFTPDYTIKLNLIPSMNLTKDIPIILDDVSFDIANYEGEREGETRFIQFTLKFTVKGFLFGPVNAGNIIKTAITNLYDWKNIDGKYLYLVLSPGGEGNFLPKEIVYQSNTIEKSNASATVLDWSNTTNRLLITDTKGTFLTNETLTGTQSGAKWNIINYEILPVKIETITVTPVPPTANADDHFGFNIQKQFFDIGI